MKTIWSVVSILAVAHILALLGVVGFLAGTDRLDRSRIEAVRQVFVPTLSQQEEAEAEVRNAQDERLEQARREANLDGANPGVDLRNEGFRSVEQTQLELVRRGERDLENLTAMLDRRLREIERRERELLANEAAFEERFGAKRDAAKEEQFQKMVSLLGKLRAEDLKAKLDVYLLESREDLVVDILQALPLRSATKVLALYQSQTDNIVAADLLLRVKNQGLPDAREEDVDPIGVAAADESDP